MASEMNARAEYNIERRGVSYRRGTNKFVLEMRPPNWKFKINFGSYKTKPEAMVARDYGAFLRNSAGEDAATAGGYFATDHPSIYEFAESLAIFQSLEGSKDRCNEFKELIPLCEQPKEKWDGDAIPPHWGFCKKARKDIQIAIGLFRERYPHKLLDSRPTESTIQGVPMDETLDGTIRSTSLSSNSEFRVSQNLNVPEISFCLQDGCTLEVEQIMSRSAPENNMMPWNGLMDKEKFPFVSDTFGHLSFPCSKLHNAGRGFNAVTGDSMFQAGQSPKKPRAKENSKHFGVRFRPDLTKWVAEIMVAEWKTADKKVWLGTFDSEEGAARAVDVARKILKCKKKRPPNFPCESLNAYSEEIPANLNLNNLQDASMFKEVTLFVKLKAQQYAASFCPNIGAGISVSSEQALAKCNSGLQELGQEFALQEDNLSMASYSPSYGISSYDSYNTQLGVMAGDGQWWSPTSAATNGSTPSSAGTSPEAQSSWFYVDNACCDYRQEMTQIEEQSIEGGWTALHLQPANSSHVENSGTVWEGQSMWSDGHYVFTDGEQWLTEVNDLLFPNDDDFFQDQTALNIVPRDEMLDVESQHQAYNICDPMLADWMPLSPQQNIPLIFLI